MNLKSSFQTLATLLSTYIHLGGLWLGVKRFFTSVWHVFVSQLVQSFCLLRSSWHLGVLTISFALPIDLYKSLWISEKC